MADEPKLDRPVAMSNTAQAPIGTEDGQVHAQHLKTDVVASTFINATSTPEVNTMNKYPKEGEHYTTSLFESKSHIVQAQTHFPAPFVFLSTTSRRGLYIAIERLATTRKQSP